MDATISTARIDNARMNNTTDNQGIPPLAGLCSYEAAALPGYSLETSVNLLRRYNYLKTQLNQILADKQ